jgi:hypothetical protein
MKNRTLRTLEGITYWVINDPNELRTFINSNLRREWERDNQEDGLDSRTDSWLLSLPKRAWHLGVLKTADVKLDSSMMANEDFATRLKERSEELRRSVSEYNAVIWPLVIREEDYQLKDGYCRFVTLRRMGVSRLMAYFGSRAAEGKRGEVKGQESPDLEVNIR